jgi:protein-S-isoprenylcysteine O-methyltransferase Ste14
VKPPLPVGLVVVVIVISPLSETTSPLHKLSKTIAGMLIVVRTVVAPPPPPPFALAMVVPRNWAPIAASAKTITDTTVLAAPRPEWFCCRCFSTYTAEVLLGPRAVRCAPVYLVPDGQCPKQLISMQMLRRMHRSVGARENGPVRRSVAATGSAIFFAAAPGTVAGLVPWWLTSWRLRQPLVYWAPLRVLGILLVAAGAAVLVHAFVRFVVEGLGTPAPVAPTTHLVVGGLYRYVRNPMYLAVVAAIIGQALLWWQPALLLYAAIVSAAFVVFVLGYEQPTLQQQFGSSYEAYRRAVPAWWPRLRPWRPTDAERGYD